MTGSAQAQRPKSFLGVAAEHATRSVPIAQPVHSVGEVRDALAGRALECADDVAVLEGDKLAGVLSIERLLAADGDLRIERIMDSDPPVVIPGADQELVARRMIDRGASSIAVVKDT